MHPLNEVCENIFCITVDRFERKEKISEILKDIKFDFFEGVDGYKITDDEYNQHRKEMKELGNYAELNKSMLGCTLSHINLYKKIIDEKLNNVLILEDDIMIKDNIKNIKNIFNQIPEDFDIIYFGLLNAHQNYDNILKSKDGIYKYDNNIFLEGTNAYFITNSFAKLVYENNSKYRYTADGGVVSTIRKYKSNCYVIIPQIIIQDLSIKPISNRSELIIK